MQNVYALPLDNNGRIMLQQFLISDFHNKINIRLFGRKLLEDSAEIKDCDCDIVDGNRRVLGFLTGNIARLKRFTDFAEVQSKTAREFEIICYKFQEIELKKYCPKSMSLLIV